MAGHVCPGCQAPLQGARCSHCGVAARAGAYRIVSVLAQTSHSRTYVATDEQGRRVALKELVFALAPDMKQVEVFERVALGEDFPEFLTLVAYEKID